jgi:hypothetical protein
LAPFYQNKDKSQFRIRRAFGRRCLPRINLRIGGVSGEFDGCTRTGFDPEAAAGKAPNAAHLTLKTDGCVIRILKMHPSEQSTL